MPYYRRKLPHIHPENGIFFITFRLADSIPKNILLQYVRDKKQFKKTVRRKFKGILTQKMKNKIELMYFEKFEQILAKNIGACWLKIPEIAHMLENQIHKLNFERYTLVCYCIMPNHVHLLIDTTNINTANESNHAGPTRYYPLTDTLRLLKGRSARQCNLALERSGSFWQKESYDHYVKSQNEFEKIISYILFNPVKAGLVEQWQDWQFNYLWDQ